MLRIRGGITLSVLLGVSLLASGAHAQFLELSREANDRQARLEAQQRLDAVRRARDIFRANPGQEIDAKALIRGAEDRQKMRPATLGGGLKGQFKTSGTNIGYSNSQWEFFGPYNFQTRFITSQGPTSSFMSGRVNSIAFDNRNQGVFYIAAASGGAWKADMTSGTVVWTPLGDKFPFPETSSVATDPTNGRIVYVGLGDFYGPGSGQGQGLDTPRFGGNGTGQGIMKSVNSGTTFVNIGFRDAAGAPIMEGTAVSSIVVHPKNPRVIVASCGRGTRPGSLWRSTDGGATWRRPTLRGGGTIPAGDWNTVRVFNPFGATYDIQTPTDPQFMYASLLNDGIYRSDDMGATWRKIANTPLAFNLPSVAGRKTLIVTPSATDPYVLYMSDASNLFQDGRIFRGQPQVRSDVNGSGQLNYLWTEITGNYNIANGGFNNWSRSEYASALFAAPAALLPPQPPPAGFTPDKAITLDILYGGNRTVSASLGADRFLTLNVMKQPTLWEDLSFAYDSPLTQRDRFHTWQRDIKYDPFDPQSILVANDGGIYGMRFDPDNVAPGFSGANLGAPGHWFTTTNLNTSGNISGQPASVRRQSFGITQINGADFSPTDSNYALLGTQNMGLARIATGATGWTNVGVPAVSIQPPLAGTASTIGNYVGSTALLGTRQFAWVINGGGNYSNGQRLVMTTNNWTSAVDISPDQSFTGSNASTGAPETHYPYPYSSTVDNGSTDTSIQSAFAGQTKSSFPVLVGDTASGRLFTGTNALWWFQPTGVETGWDTTGTPPVSQPGRGGRWKQVGTSTVGGVITAIAVTNGPENPRGNPTSQRVYIGTSTGELWMTQDDALDLATPAPTTGPAGSVARAFRQLHNAQLPARPVTSISVNPSHPEDILVTLGGTGGGHVYRCQNTRSNSIAFTDQSGVITSPTDSNFFTRLPDVPANGIARDGADPVNTWYVATDIGVFVTTDQGSTWQDATTPLGLPNVQCVAIKFINGTGFLNVATYGRGVWRINTATARQVVADPNLKSSFTLNRIGNEIFAVVTVTNEQRKDPLGNNIDTGLAENVRITASSLTTATVAGTTTALPITLGAIAPGSSRSLTLRFPGTIGGAGASATFRVSGTYVTQLSSGPVTNNTSFPAVRTRLP